jgi:hypothetical protein
MNKETTPQIEFEHEDFDFATLEDELKVDERCQALLYSFFQDLQTRGLTPEQASDLSYSADFYLRDYLLDFCRLNVVTPKPGLVKKFAATWFIKTTLDPEMALLELHLTAIRELYRFMHRQNFITREELLFLEAETENLDFYRQRIESFNALAGDGYEAWEAQCPLKD